MRRRLLFSTLAVAILAVLLLGVPLGLVGARLLREEARQRLEESAQRVAVVVDDRLERHESVAAGLARLVPSDRQVVVVDPAGHRYTGGRKLSGPVIGATAAIPAGGSVTVSSSRGPVNDRVFREWTVVGVLTVVSVSVAVGLAVLASRRLVQPLHALTAIAGRLGAGDTRPVGRRFGVPEIDRVAQVLGTSAQQIGDQLRREREFASDASHQLRTPLTALTIRLEEIALAAEEPQTVRSESQAALAQVERLTATVDALLARARGSRIENATHIDVERLLSEQVREYEPAYRHAGRSLTLGARPGLRALGTPGGIAQAVATLLDNALTHGAGTVTVGARPAADHVVVEIGDEGPGVDEALLPHIFERSVSGTAGTGLGLALARALVEADGGRLELVRARPATFAIFLPVAPAAPAADHPEPAASSPSELVV